MGREFFRNSGYLIMVPWKEEFTMRSGDINSLFSCSVMSNSFETPCTIAHQAPLSMGFFRQEYWNGLPCPPSWDLPDPEIEPTSPALAGGFFTTEPPGKPLYICVCVCVYKTETQISSFVCIILNNLPEEFPGTPVVRTLDFLCTGHRINPSSGN